MAAVDQSTRRGRLIVVFIGGLIIFSGLMLGGLYLSHQRKAQFETAQSGESTQITEETDEVTEIAGGSTEGSESNDGDASEGEGEAEANRDEADEEAAQDDEGTDTVVVTGPSGDTGGEEEASEESLPVTGPSDASTDGSPTEIPATGPEVVWIVAIVGAMAAAYAGFEYRRSRLAFRRAAMQRD